MRVHRFMSDAEYEVLVAGGRLMNATDHAKDRGQLTDSIGFCFFTEDPDKAIHWLSGCCYPDHCVTLDIPDHMLRPSTATYRDPERDDLTRGPIIGGHRPTMQKREYCLTSYALSDGVTIIADTLAAKAQDVADMMGMGLIAYDYTAARGGYRLKVFTSQAFKPFLDALKPGVKLTNRLGREFTIESEPYVANLRMCVRANGDTWFCDTLYDKDKEY